MATFTENELEAISVNAMGRASEAGVLPVMELCLAGESQNGKIKSVVMNSGYTVGFFQIDFGSDISRANDLINNYNKWANDKDKIIDIKSIARLLHNRGQSLIGTDDLRNGDIGNKLNNFFNSKDGQNYNLSLQVNQFKKVLKPELEKALQTPALKNMGREDAVIVLAAIAKTKNQAGHIDREYKYIKNNHGHKIKIKVPESEKIYPILQNADISKDDILAKIKLKHPSVSIGIDHTNKGAALYNRIDSEKSKLGQLLRDTMNNDPTLVKLGLSTHPSDQLLDAMFRNPDAAQKLIHAYNNGSAYQIDNHNGAIKDEAYTIGVTKEGQIYSVDKTGKGFYIEHDSKEWHTLNNLQDLGVAFHHHADHHHADHHHSDHHHSSRSNPPTHAEANQPLSPLAESLRGQIENLCRTEVGKLGFKWDGGMDNTVYALTAEALKNGFKQATHLALNDGIIDLGDLSADRNLLAALDSNIAAQTPAPQSLKNIDLITQNQAQAEQQKQTQQETQQQTQQQQQIQTQSKAPHMSA